MDKIIENHSVFKFCQWYNDKYGENIEPCDLEQKLSEKQLEDLSELYEKEK